MSGRAGPCPGTLTVVDTNVRGTLRALPTPLRFAIVGAVISGLLGGGVGLLVGLRTYVQTAWAASLEVGYPAACLGFLVGMAIGFSVSIYGRVVRHR